MSLKGSIKRRLGMLRDTALYGLDNRRQAVRAVQMRASWIDMAAAALPELSPAPIAPEVEVHCTVGESHSAMGLWAGWSLMRFLPQAQFVLHDDGTLSASTRATWSRLLPGLRIISREEGMVATAAYLTKFPHVLDWTQRYHFGNKLGAVQASARTLRIVEMDTDVLILRRPDALLQALGDPECSMAWNTDVHYAYAYPESLLKEILGDLIGPLPDRLNAGLTVLQVFTQAEWQMLDQVLQRMAADPRVDPMRYWMQQTLHACVASTRGRSVKALPPEYSVYHGPMRAEGVARHFVGNSRTRPRFFTEGVPILIRNARAMGHVRHEFASSYV